MGEPSDAAGNGASARSGPETGDLVVGDPADAVVAGRMGGPYRRLARGRWRLEVRGDEVADVRFDGVLLLRAVRAVVRDRDWNTVPVAVLGQEPTADGLVVRLLFDDGPIRYAAALRLALDDGALTVDLDGTALSAFARNRIGLVVLHPAGDAGAAVRVTHTDGRVADGAWPWEISPHQPFRDVAGFAWTTNGVAATLALTGEVFETEDQRNWTDASFKTYGIPLDRPFPVEVAAGETLRQGVRLTVTGHAARGSAYDDVVRVSDEIAGPLPPISLGAALYPPPDGIPAVPGVESVLVELTGDERRWPEHLRVAAGQAAVLNARLDVRLVTDDPDAVSRGVALLGDLPVPPTVSGGPDRDRRHHSRPTVRLGVFDPDGHVTTAPLWAALRAAAPPGVALVGGTRAHFTELNRRIADVPPDVPALAFGLTPQMHATEVPHVVDSLAVQATVAENALRLAGGRPVLVGPVTLARRFNAVATTAAPDPAVEAERAVDPLSTTAFAGAWTLGSLAALAPTGVAGLCYFETAGPRGVATADGVLTPAGRVLAALAPLRGRPVLRCTAPHSVAALAVGSELFVANLSAAALTVPAPGHDPVDLAPWGVRRVPVSGPG